MIAPTGTVTLLFTDIEASTQHWEEQREAMRAALRRHDEIVRACVAGREGHVFKMVGDACYAAFWRAPDAVAAALDAQRALSAEDWSAVGELKVRMALHTGATDERDGDYFGPVVNRVARMLSTAHGHQVVLSGATALLLRGVMPHEAELLDLGQHHLKDLADPEHVWQLRAPGLRQGFPPLRSLGSMPNNLPRQVTPLVGREEVLREIKALSEGAPLVTIVGSGGVGKTRAALHAGADMLDGSGDGVWFVELAPLSDRKLLAGAIAVALGLREQSDGPALEMLVAHLKSKRLLLILDNCEHLVEEAATIADAILRHCHNVRLIATSREAFGIAGEAVYAIPPLPVPPSEGCTAEGVLGYGAVLLFVERGRAADRHFELTDANAGTVAEIVRRLDGLPLAIELAAARLKALGIDDVAKRLGRKLAMLTSGNRAAPARQQTMRATIEWSYELLSDDEKRFFRRFAVFAGGGSLDAIVRCASNAGVDETVALDLLASLVDRSLVQAETNAGRRYRLLESTREFASEELAGHGERSAAARAHALAFLDLAEDLERSWPATPEEDWRRRTASDVENWRAALEWSLGDEGGAIALRLLPALQHVWFFTLSEHRRWLANAREAIDDETPASIVAKVDLYEARLYALNYRWDRVLDVARRAEGAFSMLGDEVNAAQSQRYVGYALTRLGEYSEGEAWLQTALQAYRERNDDRATAGILHDVGDARNEMGDIAGARAYYDEALQMYKAADAQESAIGIVRNLAEAEFRAGAVRTALDLALEALTYDRESKNRLHVINDLLNITAYEISLGEFDQAELHGLEALALARSRETDVYVAIAIQHLAVTAALRPGGDRERGARLLSYAQDRLGALNVRLGHTEQQGCDAALAALRAEFDNDELTRLREEGVRWNEERAIAEVSRV
jgi:predicted ATPase/class 3 adenylate cyclase